MNWMIKASQERRFSYFCRINKPLKENDRATAYYKNH